MKTQTEKLVKSIQAFTSWIKANRSKAKLNALWEEAKAKLKGHYAYYGIAFNKSVFLYYHECTATLFKWLNRRSQKSSMTWEQFQRRLRLNPLPKPWGHHLIDITQGELNYAI